MLTLFLVIGILKIKYLCKKYQQLTKTLCTRLEGGNEESKLPGFSISRVFMGGLFHGVSLVVVRSSSTGRIIFCPGSLYYQIQTLPSLLSNGLVHTGIIEPFEH